MNKKIYGNDFETIITETCTLCNGSGNDGYTVGICEDCSGIGETESSATFEWQENNYYCDWYGKLNFIPFIESE